MDLLVAAQLIDVLRRSDPVACSQVEDDLVDLGQIAVQPLLETVSTLPPPGQYHATRALGRIGDVRAIPALLQALTQESGRRDDGSEWFAAEALARIGTAALNPLLALLSSDNANVRRWSTVALGEMRDPRAVEALLQRVSDTDSDVCKAALIAIGQIGDRRAVNVLMFLLESPDADLRMFAVRALGQCLRGEVFAPLVRLAQRSGHLQRAAIYALVDSAGPLAFDLLADLLNDSDPCARMAAMNGLAQFDDERVLLLLEVERPDDLERCHGGEWAVGMWRTSMVRRIKQRREASDPS